MRKGRATNISKSSSRLALTFVDLCDSDNDVLPGLPDAFQRKDTRCHPMRTIWNRARIRIKRLISIRHLRQAEIYV
ncbi:hypothetical protein KU53_23410 [Salmonella enterica subsp. enterica]|nr:hypothetical protein [Salmonella enterica subsp. enterica]EAA7503453.1 hypothetical protein [Salmonella enterica subsp. enterica serovar Thompson]EAM9327778.1 hypothetical protein [Salmonella enterica]EBS3953107.1 hypothetical protein [Salmonella enterica subsp. enterica serovar Augustenborg]EBW8002357.1 hypothetical protein [Salmonella enterica subsp. enterica serovar Mgulani]